MNYLGRVIDNFRYAYKEINAATLTGAIDVIVVEQPDGTYSCSPFHVRFGKIGVLRSREKIVEIEINGEPCDIYMKLGESGEAFFVEELSKDDRTLPHHLVCSPIPYSDDVEEAKCESAVWNSVSHNKSLTDAVPERHHEDSLDLPTSTVPIKTFHAKTVQSLSDCDIPMSSEFRPIRNVPEREDCYSSPEVEKPVPKSTVTECTAKSNGTKKKRKRRKKAVSIEGKEEVGEEDGAKTAGDVHVLNEKVHCLELQKSDPLDEEIADLEAESECPVVTSIASDLHFFSDTDIPCGNHEAKQFSPIQSDTEFEVSNRPKSCEDCDIVDSEVSKQQLLAHRPSWRWGELPSPILKSEIGELPGQKEPTKERNQEVQRSMLASMLGFMKKAQRIRNNDIEGSIYLSQLDPDELDPEIARLYLPHCHCMDTFKNEDISKPCSQDDKDEDVESGNGPSLAQSPVSDVENSSVRPPVSPDESAFSINKDDWDVAMSLCGGLNNDPTDEQFNQHLITYEQFVNDPAIFKNPNLMFRINGRICHWDIACPVILSIALYKKPLSKEVVERLEIEASAKSGKPTSVDSGSRHRRGYYSWFYWARTTRNKSVTNESLTNNDSKEEMEPATSTGLAMCEGETVSTVIVDTGDGFEDVTPDTTTNSADFLNYPQTDTADIKRLRTYSSTDSEFDTSTDDLLKREKPEKYRKTLRLTSEQIASLNLRTGANELVFSVTTAYQGTTRCKCTLFSWRYDDKIVISDIDGTITKSDVLGHIMPIVGNAWAQSGVAKLFNRIEDNGYKLLYLSARAIGQSKHTRKYLNSIRQEDFTLPDGPLLLNPTSLLSAFHREVIERKPEEFKISCLRDIQALFPVGSNPFYAGYGNKINDVWTYQAVGIPMFRIFTINHRGELRHELTNTFQSSYLSMSQYADQLFPVRSKQTVAEEFSEFNYWRDPIPDVSLLLV